MAKGEKRKLPCDGELRATRRVMLVLNDFDAASQSRILANASAYIGQSVESTNDSSDDEDAFG